MHFENVRKELLQVVLKTLILALALRGPSGGHCVGLSFWASQNPRASKQWARRAHSLPLRLVASLEAPRSGPRRAPGGSVQGFVIRYTTFDNSFRTRVSRYFAIAKVAYFSSTFRIIILCR